MLLEYLGNPGRNIQLPHSVLNIAKGKSRPELAARYLIRNLFTEEVLIKSNVYGNLGYGMYALNPNRINALRGWLHVEYVRINKRQITLQKGRNHNPFSLYVFWGEVELLLIPSLGYNKELFHELRFFCFGFSGLIALSCQAYGNSNTFVYWGSRSKLLGFVNLPKCQQ